MLPQRGRLLRVFLLRGRLPRRGHLLTASYFEEYSPIRDVFFEYSSFEEFSRDGHVSFEFSSFMQYSCDGDVALEPLLGGDAGGDMASSHFCQPTMTGRGGRGKRETDMYTLPRRRRPRFGSIPRRRKTPKSVSPVRRRRRVEVLRVTHLLENSSLIFPAYLV